MAVARETLERTINGHTAAIAVQPELGANLVSLVVDGKELIFWDEAAYADSGRFTGCFHMFPVPCRMPGGEYTFEGKNYVQRIHGNVVDIHGLLRHVPVGIGKGTDSLTAVLEVTPGHPVYEGYPFPCTMQLTYTLIESGLEIHFDFTNTGNTNAPFGYGLHPFWKLSGTRQETAIRVPCGYLMDLEDLIPTGGITPVEGVLDLRQLTVLEGMNIDNLFWKRDLETPALVEWRDSGHRLTLEASPEFNHMIAYAPEDEGFVCVEFLTCAPNQINLANGPGRDVAGLVVVPPGGAHSGWVRYTLERM